MEERQSLVATTLSVPVDGVRSSIDPLGYSCVLLLLLVAAALRLLQPEPPRPCECRPPSSPLPLLKLPPQPNAAVLLPPPLPPPGPRDGCPVDAPASNEAGPSLATVVRTLAAANASACLQLEPDYGFGGLANTVGMMNAVLAYALASAPELSFRFSPLLAPSAQHRDGSWRTLFFQPANDLTGRGCRRDGGDGPRLGATTCLRCPAELPCEAATLVARPVGGGTEGIARNGATLLLPRACGLYSCQEASHVPPLYDFALTRPLLRCSTRPRPSPRCYGLC